MNYKIGLPPVIAEASRVLILGTLPGDESLRLRQYYANSANQFWRILAQVYGEAIATDYSQRLEFLQRKGLALWDVLQSAEREGSSDRGIKNAVANDFSGLIAKYGALTTIAFNGRAAEGLFRRYVERQQHPPAGDCLRKLRLPSTSSAPGRYVTTFEEKVLRWDLLLTL